MANKGMIGVASLGGDGMRGAPRVTPSRGDTLMKVYFLLQNLQEHWTNDDTMTWKDGDGAIVTVVCRMITKRIITF